MGKRREQLGRILTPTGERRISRKRWLAAIEGRYLQRLSAEVAELAPGVSLVYVNGVRCFCRVVKRQPYVLTNWVLIRKMNPTPASEVTQ